MARPITNMSPEAVARREYQKRYYERHKEEAKQYQREYSRTHRRQIALAYASKHGKKSEPPVREKEQSSYTYHDLMKAPANKFVNYLDRIISGKADLS